MMPLAEQQVAGHSPKVRALNCCWFRIPPDQKGTKARAGSSGLFISQAFFFSLGLGTSQCFHMSLSCAFSSWNPHTPSNMNVTFFVSRLHTFAFRVSYHKPPPSWRSTVPSPSPLGARHPPPHPPHTHPFFRSFSVVSRRTGGCASAISCPWLDPRASKNGRALPRPSQDVLSGMVQNWKRLEERVGWGEGRPCFEIL